MGQAGTAARSGRLLAQNPVSALLILDTTDEDRFGGWFSLPVESMHPWPAASSESKQSLILSLSKSITYKEHPACVPIGTVLANIMAE